MTLFEDEVCTFKKIKYENFHVLSLPKWSRHYGAHSVGLSRSPDLAMPGAEKTMPGGSRRFDRHSRSSSFPPRRLSFDAIRSALEKVGGM